MTPIPKFVEPMKARLLESPPAGDWIYEIKFDGWRALGLKGGSGVKLLSRNQKDLAERFPGIHDAIARLKADDLIIDGEIVALDEQGRSSFQLLSGGEETPVCFYAFDLVRLNGKDLRSLPLLERKAILEKLLKRSPAMIRYSPSLGGDAPALLKQVGKLELEGLIGKQPDSPYEAGQRSGKWIKLKINHEQEFVIGGYSNPTGSRQGFGSLLVGVYEEKYLKFAGKVGTGFNGALLDSLHAQFQKISSDKCPFPDLPEKSSGRYGGGVTAAEMKRCHWLKPRMVCQVKFTEWTREGKLRHPVFVGLREDKNPLKVVHEKAG